MRHPNLLIYNAVYGIDEMTLPSPIYDYERMYKILQPFILTKEVYDAGVQFYTPTVMNVETQIQTHPQLQSPTSPQVQIQPPPPTYPQPQTQPHLKEESIKITFIESNVQNTHTQVLPPPPPPPPRHAKPEHSAPTFVPINKQPDPLFWCLFISLNGIKEYQYLNGRYTNRIVEEKQKLVNFIKSKEIESTMKSFLKKNKITGVSLKTMMSGVLSNEPIDFKNIILYCYFYKVNVRFVNFDKRVYFTVIGNEDENDCKNDANMCYIEFSLKTPHNTPEEKQKTLPLVKKYKYFILHRCTPENPVICRETKVSPTTPSFINWLTVVRPGDSFILTDEEKIKQSKTYFNIENAEKPLNAMTAYKICELNTIAQQLGLLEGKEDGVKLKKNDVYALISDYFKEIL
jgi:hypothetical protein